MVRQVMTLNLLQCVEHLRAAYKPLKEAAAHMSRADSSLCPDFRIAPIVEVKDTLQKQLGILDVEIGWIEEEIARRQKEA